MNMKRITLLAFCLLSSGCVNFASFNDHELSNYKISRDEYLFERTSVSTIDKTVGIKELWDARPQQDRAFTKKMPDLSLELTQILLGYFNEYKVFKEIHYPPKPGDDLIIEGSINRFFTKSGKCMVFSPFDFCVEDQVDITLEVKDNVSGATIAKLNGKGDNSNAGSWIMQGCLTCALNNAVKELVKQCHDKYITGLNYNKIDYSDGINSEEASFIAQKYWLDKFWSTASQYKLPPSVEDAESVRRGEWLVEFVDNPYNVYVVFVDKNTGKITFADSVYNDDATKILSGDLTLFKR